MGINKEFEQYHRRLFPDYEEFIAALRKPSRKSIRVNTLKVDRNRVEEFLKKNNIPFSQIPWCPDGLWID
jgi:16S rRNA (cytosine1407-C5)-methyltransferase